MCCFRAVMGKHSSHIGNSQVSFWRHQCLNSLCQWAADWIMTVLSQGAQNYFCHWSSTTSKSLGGGRFQKILIALGMQSLLSTVRAFPEVSLSMGRSCTASTEAMLWTPIIIKYTSNPIMMIIYHIWTKLLLLVSQRWFRYSWAFTQTSSNQWCIYHTCSLGSFVMLTSSEKKQVVHQHVWALWLSDFFFLAWWCHCSFPTTSPAHLSGFVTFCMRFIFCST